MQFNIYIDESGDAGLKRVRTATQKGASPYLTLGALVCQPSAEIHIRNTLDMFKNEIGKKKWKHSTDLNHAQLVFFGRSLGRLPVRYFGVISRKSTLDGYRDQINSDPDKFYNKCAKYLLETVFAYISKYIDSTDDVRVIFEERNHDYDAMRRYLRSVADDPQHPRAKVLSNLNVFAISAVPKKEEELLLVADYVAHALYQCTNRTPQNFGIPEPRYFREICSRFGADQNGQVINHGIKCIHNLKDLGLDIDVEETIEDAKAQPPFKR